MVVKNQDLLKNKKQVNAIITINGLVKKLLLSGNKFMPKTHLIQPAFTIVLVYHVLKRIQNFKETGDTKYIYRNELDKDCLQHDMTYGDFKDLAKIAASDKVFKDKAFNIAKNPKYAEYQRGLACFYGKFKFTMINFSIKNLKVVMLIIKLKK